MENKGKRKIPAWLQIVKRYQTPTIPKSVWQIVNSYIPYFTVWAIMVYTLQFSYWLTLALAVLAAGFLVRIFIIQHDCGHQSFFKSRKANDILGAISGVLTFTPYDHWRNHHARHHANSGDLDFRGIGDVDTLTVDEYLALNWRGRLKYRVYRSPFLLFLVTPSLLFLFAHRFPYKTNKAEKKGRTSVWKTNAALLVGFLALGFIVGYKEVLMIQLPITMLSASMGVYLFYVQHQFEDTYWRHHKEWDYETAALVGSSFFMLPKVFQWFTGNIGYHHVHHLSPLIPNYLLENAHEENEIFQNVETLTFTKSVKSAFLHLWDEQADRLISFRELRKRKVSVAT